MFSRSYSKFLCAVTDPTLKSTNFWCRSLMSPILWVLVFGDLQLSISHVPAAVTSELSMLYLPTLTPYAWVSRLRVENFDLTPSHACGPISHAWLKNVSCCRLAWHNFQKYVNSDPWKGRKPCVKWINDNTFLAISDFVDKRFLDNFAFGRLRTSSDFFGRLQTSSGIFGNDRVVFKNPSTPRMKISRLYLRKSWQVYNVTYYFGISH